MTAMTKCGNERKNGGDNDGGDKSTDETSKEGKGKGNGGKGEHEGKGGIGRRGMQQVENLVMDEIQENHREGVRKLVVAPHMGAGGSHPQAMSVPEGKETQGMRWADCDDDAGKEEEEREQETLKEIKGRDGARGDDERGTTGFRAERRKQPGGA